VQQISPQSLGVVPMPAGLAPVSSVIYCKHSERLPRPVSMCAYISAQCIHLSQHCLTSIDALSSPGKRAWEEEINCQTMHRSHPLWFSSCQMISKHYWMHGCIIYRASSPPPAPLQPFHIPVVHYDGFLGLPQKIILNDSTFIILFSDHLRVEFWQDCMS